MMNTECFRCPDRYIGCHSKCEKYIDKAIVERNKQAEEQKKYALYLKYINLRQNNIRKRLVIFIQAEGVKLNHIAGKINIKPFEIYGFKCGYEDLSMRTLNKLENKF